MLERVFHTLIVDFFIDFVKHNLIQKGRFVGLQKQPLGDVL